MPKVDTFNVPTYVGVLQSKKTYMSTLSEFPNKERES